MSLKIMYGFYNVSNVSADNLFIFSKTPKPQNPKTPWGINIIISEQKKKEEKGKDGLRKQRLLQKSLASHAIERQIWGAAKFTCWVDDEYKWGLRRKLISYRFLVELKEKM